MDFTPAARLYFKSIDRTSMSAALDPERTQRTLLKDLIYNARSTEWGVANRYRDITGYDYFRTAVPLSAYEDLRPLIDRMLRGEKNILWPGRVSRFAQSSGTSDGKSKYIPLTGRSLKRCHYRGGSAVVARYLALYPDSRLFSGRSFILGGSYANELHTGRNVRIGDLSASLINCINPIANLFRSPSKQIALMEDWTGKLPRLVEATANRNITNISGVPSWFFTVLQKILRHTGASEIHEVWPSLEVFFHGGISFAPYREQYDSIIDPARMRYMETYNASEGFFALQTDPTDRAMMLLADTDVFYEFIPLDKLDDRTAAIPLWEVETGKTYALAISSGNGLWRYLIGDTVRIERTSPVKITIAGRTRSFINTFGEELMVHNADAAIAATCRQTGASVSDYTAAPVYARNGHRGRHEWMIEFNVQPADIDDFTRILDANLQKENSDYQAKRSGDIFLAPPTVTALPHGTFDRWLAATGKLGGQRKVPRLKNDRSVIDDLKQYI